MGRRGREAGMSVRETLPNRRRNETVSINYNGHEMAVTVGFSDDGRPLEVFANVAKTGTEIAHMVADACVIISLALQYGATPQALSKSLGRVPDVARGEDAEKAASILGEIVAVVAASYSPWPAGRQA